MVAPETLKGSQLLEPASIAAFDPNGVAGTETAHPSRKLDAFALGQSTTTTRYLERLQKAFGSVITSRSAPPSNR